MAQATGLFLFLSICVALVRHHAALTQGGHWIQNHRATARVEVTVMAYSFTEKKRIRKDFGKRSSVLEVPYLLAIQL
ncbi:MAG TPA: hypothetical protein VNF48_03760, partial [Gammaproteobacteria bacterium]|nr:hypothetical protein [Gammaproteobacteria bacterium]